MAQTGTRVQTNHSVLFPISPSQPVLSSRPPASPRLSNPSPMAPHLSALYFILLYNLPTLLGLFFLLPTRFRIHDVSRRTRLYVLCCLWTLAFGLPYSSLIAMSEGYVGSGTCLLLVLGSWVVFVVVVVCDVWTRKRERERGEGERERGEYDRWVGEKRGGGVGL